MRKRQIHDDGINAVGNQMLSLALFIMLLAFFIVLNTISSYDEERVRPVIQSIEGSFASKITQADNVQPSMRQEETQSDDEGDVLDKLEALFTAQIPALEIDMNKDKGVVYITLSWDDFETAVMSLGQAPDTKEGSEAAIGDYFLSTLIALVKNDQAGLPYRMDIFLNMNENPAKIHNNNPEEVRTARRKLGKVAIKVEKTGLPQRYMSIGVRKGDEGMVDLIFRPHIPFNPLGESLNTEAEEEIEEAADADAEIEGGVDE